MVPAQIQQTSRPGLQHPGSAVIEQKQQHMISNVIGVEIIRL